MANRKIRTDGAIKTFLAEWIAYKGTTQTSLGAEVDIDPSSISRYARGETRMSLDVQAKIAAALGIQPLDLFRSPTQPAAQTVEQHMADLIAGLSDDECQILLNEIRGIVRRLAATR